MITAATRLAIAETNVGEQDEVDTRYAPGPQSVGNRCVRIHPCDRGNGYSNRSGGPRPYGR